MKKTKIALLVFGAVVVVVAAALFFLLQNLDGLVKSAIEKYGSEATGTPVQVQAVKFALRQGRGTVAGVTVGNPQGFSSRPIFRLGEITVAVDTTSLTSKLPVVREIHVVAPAFRYEVNGHGQTNLAVLQRHLQQVSAAASGKGAKGPSAAAKSGGVHLLVKKLRIDGGVGILDLTGVGGKVLQAKLPPLTLTDLGGRQGLTPSALGQTVLAALSRELEQVAARRGIEQAVRSRLQGKAGKLEQKLDRNLGPAAGGALKKLLGR